MLQRSAQAASSADSILVALGCGLPPNAPVTPFAQDSALFAAMAERDGLVG